MELYGFISHPFVKEDLEDISAISTALTEYKIQHSIQFVPVGDEFRIVITGSLYGEDTSIGDTELATAFSGWQYYYINLYNAVENNVPNI